VAADDGSGFDELVARTSDAALILDPLADRFVSANAAACALLGYDLAELLEMPVSRIHPGELAQLRDLVDAVVAEGYASTVTLTCRTRAGDRLPTEMAVWAFRRAGGRVYLFALVESRSQHRAR
jgi:PAS domain S-box-containing protein